MSRWCSTTCIFHSGFIVSLLPVVAGVNFLSAPLLTNDHLWPKDIVIYVVTHDTSPVGDCSAKSWVSNALRFGYQVVYYGQNATRQTRSGDLIPTRRVEDYGALSGVRDNRDVWPRFAANILEDIFTFAPEAKFIMRMDDDSVLHPWNLWRSLMVLPHLDENRDIMIGDCGNDEHHSVWCSGGAGVVVSRSLAHKLVQEMRAGARSRDVCAVVGRNDDDTMGICAEALRARMISHRGFHPFPPVSLHKIEPLPWYTWWPHLSSWLGKTALLDGCPAEQMNSLVVVKDWITYHHTDCEVQNLLTNTTDARISFVPALKSKPDPLCAGTLDSSRFSAQQVTRRCEAQSEVSQRMLCGNAR